MCVWIVILQYSMHLEYNRQSNNQEYTNNQVDNITNNNQVVAINNNQQVAINNNQLVVINNNHTSNNQDTNNNNKWMISVKY